jgi:AraC-like DNA-binding protein
VQVQVSISLVRALFSAVERSGANRTQFLEQARIEPQLLEQAEARMELTHYVRALEAALDVTGDPALGLHIGQHSSSVMFPVVANLAENAQTLGDAIDNIVRFSGLLAAGFEPYLVEEEDQVAWRLPYLIGDSNPVRLTAELATAGFMRLLRQYLGENILPTRVCFAYRAPEHADEYRKVFAGRECFEQRFTEVKFPKAWLARTQLYANRELYALLQTHAELGMSRLAHGQSISERVERVLAASKPRELPTMEAVAKVLDISARTLARKLQAEGVAYAQLVEGRRSSAAKCLLAARRLTIQEVASALGFADAPAFHKAFRRWTGLTPKQYVATVMR